MNPISRFLKLRKQNDKVKIAVLMFALAIGFLLSGILRISEFAAYTSATSEYILLPASSASLSPERIAWLCDSEGIISASLQRKYTITVGSGETQIPIPVMEVSSKYLADCFHIQTGTSGEEVFYLNKAAFDRLSAASSISSERKSYTINNGASHQARFLLCDSIPGETAAAFYAGTSVSLNTHSAESVRVMYQDSDITELRERELSSAGFSIQNQQDLLKGAYEKELFLKDILYDAVIIAITLTAGIALLPSRYIDPMKQ